MRVVGVDDWACRKGHNHGTIVVDLERREVSTFCRIVRRRDYGLVDAAS